MARFICEHYHAPIAPRTLQAMELDMQISAMCSVRSAFEATGEYWNISRAPRHDQDRVTFVNEVLNCVMCKPQDNVDRLVGWTLLWPFSVVNTMLFDLTRRVVEAAIRGGRRLLVWLSIMMFGAREGDFKDIKPL